LNKSAAGRNTVSEGSLLQNNQDQFLEGTPNKEKWWRQKEVRPAVGVGKAAEMD
jgi:hypothetical protein